MRFASKLRMTAAALVLTALPTKIFAQEVNLLLDWAFEPHHSSFILAQENGYYKEAGLDVKIEQGKGSGNTVLAVAQGGFDIGHANVTTAASAIAKGLPLKVVAIYQHKTGGSFVGISGKVKLDSPESLKGLKIGSTPGGSDALSLSIFKNANNIPDADLSVVSMEGSAKLAALLSGAVDVASAESFAYGAFVKNAGHEPEILYMSDYGVPLLGFGFVVNDTFLEAEPETVKKFLAATKKGFAAAAADPLAACETLASKVQLAGSMEQCVDYFTRLLALSTPPTDDTWGHQNKAEWEALIATLRDTQQITVDLPLNTYYVEGFEP